ncbi:MAG: tetratricopeptide repeat protein [Candidatus Riflebacteria bacterium]|nr:tetratricopeptide repeat protein [Candidatus Riflebacteria bacterium]
MITFHNCPPPPEPFVGRERELELLEKRLRDSPLITLVGAGGIGKTALAVTLASRAAESLDLIPLFVACRPGWAAGAFLAAIHLELSRLGEESFGVSLRDRTSSVRDRTVHLAGLLDRGGFLLVADDLGQLPAQDMKILVGALVDRLERGRIVATSRRTVRYTSLAGRSGFEMRLKVLGRDDAIRLLAALGRTERVDDLLARAGGHPLYLRLVARGGAVAGAAGVLESVLAGLGPLDLEALRALCVLRVPVSHSDTVDLAGPASASTLERLEDLFILTRVHGGRRHLPAFVADPLRQKLGPDELKARHRRAAELFEARYLAEMTLVPDAVVEAFHHFVEAGDADRATLLLAQAAATLEAKGCFRELLMLTDQADPEYMSRPNELALIRARSLRLVGKNREALRTLAELEAICPRGALAAAIWAEKGQVLQDLSDGDGALKEFYRALELAREVGARLLEAQLNNKVATVLKDRGEYDRAVPLYRQAADFGMEVSADVEVAFAMHNMAKIHYLRGRLDQARALVERAQNSYERLDDPMGRALARNLVANIHRDLGDLVTAREIYSENLATYRSLGSRFGEAFSLSNLGDVAREEGRIEEAREAYLEARQLSVAIGNRFGEGIYTTRLAEAHRACGDYTEALAAVAQARTIWEAIKNTSGVGWALTVEGEIQRDRGAYAEALAALEQAESIRQRLKESGGLAVCLLARSMILADLGDLSAASSLAERAAELLAKGGGPDSPQNLSSQAYLLFRRGDRKGARQILEALIAPGPVGPSTRERVRALGSLAAVHVAEGDPARARNLIEESLRFSRGHHDRRGEAIALVQLGAVLASQGELDRAAESFRSSLALAQGLGDRRGEAQAALGLGETMLELGALEEAQRFLGRAVELSQGGGYVRPETRALLGLAEAALARKLSEQAAELAGRALDRAVAGALGPEKLFAQGVLALAGQGVAGCPASRMIEELEAQRQGSLAGRLKRYG